MGFGNQLFQLAQGIIANEQRRKQLELQEEQQSQQMKQAERTFALRKQEVEARQGFLELQTKQLENKVAEEASPDAVRKRKLELDFMQERILSMRAERTGRGEAPQQTVSEQLRLGDAHRRIDQDAKTARTDLTIRNLLDGEDVPAGIDNLVVLEGIEGAGVRSWEGLNAAVEASQKDLRSLEQAKLPKSLLEPRLKAATTKRDNLIKARSELRKVFDQPTSGDEFRRAAPNSFPDAFVAELFENGSSVEARKREIWGDGLFSQGREKMLKVAIDDIRQGRTETLRGFVQMFPANLLDGDGRLSSEGVRDLAGYLNSEGVSQDTVINLVNQFNQRGGLGAAP